MAMERAVLPSCWINRNERAVKIIYITSFESFTEQKNIFTGRTLRDNAQIFAFLKECDAIFEKQTNKQNQNNIPRNLAVIVFKINEGMFVPNF